MNLRPVRINATVMWASLNERNGKTGKYQVDLCQLTDDAVEKLKTLGVEARTREDQPEKGYFIVCKSQNYPIPAVDAHGKPIDAQTKIGNGSRASAMISSYAWNPKWGKDKRSPTIKGNLTITDLVEYVPSVVDEEEEEL